MRGGKSPNVTFEQARQAGYKVAIVPGLLMTNVVATCEMLLEEMKQLGAHPKFAKEMTVRELFSRFGADDWDPLRERYSR